MTAAPIGVAILGAGIGAEHLDGFRTLPQAFAPRWLCDLDLDRARVATGGDPAIALTSDLAEVLADPAVQLVDVCLPPHLHFPVTAAALRAGKHVICEKPLVHSLDEAEALADLARETGRRIFPVFQYRFGHAFRQFSALKAAGLTGKPLVASAETHWNRGDSYYAIPWRGTWAGECGGALLGHAIHIHDLLTHVLGPLAEVFALTDTRVNPIETEDCAAISLRFANGALATSSVTLGAADDSTRLRFVFSGLTAESDRLPYAPGQADWRFTARDPADQPRVDAVLAATPRGPSGFDGFVAAVAGALGLGDAPAGSEVTLEDGIASIALVTALYKSARAQGPVSLPLAPDDPFRKGWKPADL